MLQPSSELVNRIAVGIGPRRIVWSVHSTTGAGGGIFIPQPFTDVSEESARTFAPLWLTFQGVEHEPAFFKAPSPMERAPQPQTRLGVAPMLLEDGSKLFFRVVEPIQAQQHLAKPQLGKGPVGLAGG